MTMTRSYCMILALLIAQGAFCDAAIADPDISIVRAVINSEKSQVVAAGRTRVDLVSALIDGLEECEVSADEITVGPWTRLPKRLDPAPDQLVITVCVSDSFEGTERTAFIGVKPKTPFKIVAAVAKRLTSCGLTDVRLLSEETVVAEIIPMASPSRTAAETASTQPENQKRITKP